MGTYKQEDKLMNNKEVEILKARYTNEVLVILNPYVIKKTIYRIRKSKKKRKSKNLWYLNSSGNTN